jgi:hypothetical protein
MNNYEKFGNPEIDEWFKHIRKIFKGVIEVPDNDPLIIDPEGDSIIFSRHTSECIQVADSNGNPIPGNTFWGMRVEWWSDLMEGTDTEVWVGGGTDECWNTQPCCNYSPQHQCKCRCKDNLPSNSSTDGPLGGYIYAHTVPYCNRYDHWWYPECNYTTPEMCCWHFSIGECNPDESRQTEEHEHSGNCTSMCTSYCAALNSRDANNYPIDFIPFGPPAPWSKPISVSGPDNSGTGGCYVTACTSDDNCQPMSDCYGSGTYTPDHYIPEDGYCWSCLNWGNTWCSQ